MGIAAESVDHVFARENLEHRLAVVGLAVADGNAGTNREGVAESGGIVDGHIHRKTVAATGPQAEAVGYAILRILGNVEWGGKFC